MNELNNIEEQFRQQLQQMDVKTTASADEMWSRIEGQLPAKRGIAWYWIAGGAALLLLGLGIGYFLANEKTVAQQYQGESHNLPVNTPTERSFDSEKTETTPSISTSSNEEKTSTTKSTSNTEKTVVSPSSKANTSESVVADSNKKSPKEKKSVEQKATAKAYTANRKDNNQKENISSLEIIESASSTELGNEPLSNLSSEVKSSVTPSSEVIVLPLQSKGQPLQVANDKTSASFDSNAHTGNQTPVALGDPMAPGVNPNFQLGFAYQPQITLISATENTTYPVQYGSGFSAFLLKSKEGYYYSAGFEYNQTRYGYRYHQETPTQYTYYNHLLNVIENEDGTYTNVYGDTTVNAKTITDVAHNNVYKQMGLNLEIGKQWTLGRSSVMAGMQANFYYIPQQVGRYTTADYYTGQERNPERGMKSMIVVPAVTAQWRYQVAPKWNLHAGMRLTILPSYIWNTEQSSTLFRPNLMLGVSRTFMR